MGKKRKVETVSTTAKEVKISNVFPEIDGDENMHSRTGRNANAKEVTSVGNSLHQDSNLVSPKEKTKKQTNVDVRRSVRVQKLATRTAGNQNVKHGLDHSNLVESESKEAAEGHQVSPLPVITETILEQEPPETQELKELNTVLPVTERNGKEKGECIVQAVDEVKSPVNTSNASPQTGGKENMHSLTDQNANAKQVTSVRNSLHQDSNLLPPKEKTSTPTIVDVRRSVRVKKSLARNAGSQKVKQVLEHINVVERGRKEAAEGHLVSPLPVETEKILERELPQAEQLNTVLPVNDRNVEEKGDCTVQAVDESKSPVTERQNEEPCAELSYKSLYIESQKKIEKLTENNFDLVRKLAFALGKNEAVTERNNEEPCANFSCKSLYIESQKKIEELMEDNFDLVRKLDFALGKVEAYQKMIGASKEATVSLSPQEVQGHISPIGAAADHILSTKRKKFNSRSAADDTEVRCSSNKR